MPRRASIFIETQRHSGSQCSIHRAQFHARDWPCPAAAEPEAYRLQEAWLAERGIDPGFEWVEIYLHARCPSDRHP